MVTPLEEERRNLREQWIERQCGPIQDLRFASADASTRSYFRIYVNDQSYVLMDDPSPRGESSVLQFLNIQSIMHGAGLRVPEVFAYDIDLGFVLLSDFGDTVYLNILSEDNADLLYSLAMTALLQMRTVKPDSRVPRYEAALLHREMMLFDRYYLQEQTKLSFLRRVWPLMAEKTAERCAQMSACFVHRDFHSRNVMYLGEGQPVGILDFQDAVWGAQYYDLASLLRDAYILLSDEQEERYLRIFYEAVSPRTSFEAMYHEYTLLSFQRHLKIIGIFRRLYQQGKTRYMADVPRVMSYLCRESAFLKQELGYEDFCSALEEHCNEEGSGR